MGAEEMRLDESLGAAIGKRKEPHSVLEEFFEALESSVALLKIRSQPCTFTAVAAAVESVTKRRFLRSHLAQIKHLFPEAIECDSFTWRDRDTSTTKTDLRIKLLPFGGAEMKGAKSASGMSRKFSADTVARRREFHRRVVAFAGSHKQEDGIPEAALTQEAPEPEENKPEENKPADAGPIPDLVTGKVAMKTGYQAIVSRRLRSDDQIDTSHFPGSFRRSFSKPRNVLQAETPASAEPLSPPAAQARTPARAPAAKAPVEMLPEPEPETPQNCKLSFSTLEVHTEPGSRTRHYSSVASVEVMPKLDPEATPPKRQSVVKSLRFDDRVTESGKKILESIPDELLQSIRQKEQKALEEQSSRPAKRRQQMMAGLTQFFNQTRLTFQSSGRLVMLHRDLVELIQSSSVEITDKDEIMERLQLLLELAPEWISSQTSLTGETLYRVQKSVEFSAIRKRILDAASSSKSSAAHDVAT